MAFIEDVELYLAVLHDRVAYSQLCGEKPDDSFSPEPRSWLDYEVCLVGPTLVLFDNDGFLLKTYRRNLSASWHGKDQDMCMSLRELTGYMLSTCERIQLVDEKSLQGYRVEGGAAFEADFIMTKELPACLSSVNRKLQGVEAVEANFFDYLCALAAADCVTSLHFDMMFQPADDRLATLNAWRQRMQGTHHSLQVYIPGTALVQRLRELIQQLDMTDVILAGTYEQAQDVIACINRPLSGVAIKLYHEYDCSDEVSFDLPLRLLDVSPLADENTQVTTNWPIRLNVELVRGLAMTSSRADTSEITGKCDMLGYQSTKPFHKPLSDFIKTKSPSWLCISVRTDESRLASSHVKLLTLFEHQTASGPRDVALVRLRSLHKAFPNARCFDVTASYTDAWSTRLATYFNLVLLQPTLRDMKHYYRIYDQSVPLWLLDLYCAITCANISIPETVQAILLKSCLMFARQEFAKEEYEKDHSAPMQ
eukprot:TRINITY_DN4405_c0_g1_i1.p1 TRINITY_DN4405_c0_g1~~TRINITY_DN4405_c0_g1_i1.p1  ORF type:complete len:480 (+),score=67.41 TRINITY_DN4405_c0_g1_i1:1-1440(+)